MRLLHMKKSSVFIIAILLTCKMAFPSDIGKWMYDEQGLPCFNYTGKLPFILQGVPTQYVNQNDDPYFLLGNHRFTVFQHVSGNYQLLSGERAWGILNRGNINEYADTQSEMNIDGADFKLSGKNSISLETSTTKIFGSGFSRFDYKLPGISCSRIVSVQPSKDVKSGIPAIMINIQLKNNSDKKKTIRFSETVNASYKMIGSKPYIYYLCNSSKNESNTIVKTDFSFKSSDPYLLMSDEAPSYYDGFPPSLYMKRHRLTSPSVKSSISLDEIDSTQHELTLLFEMELDPGGTENIFFVVGYEYQTNFEQIEDVFSDITAPQIPGTISGALFQKEWRDKVPLFETEKNKVLKRELQWDAYTLDAMATYVSHYDEIFIPQGMFYDYLLGNPAAFRDHAQSALPLCFYNPEMARSVLKMCLKKIKYSGEIRYTDTGYGSTTNMAWNTSDQQLYFFFLLGEYLRITEDYSILQEETEWYPVVLKNSATTMEKVQNAFFYLRDEVRFGTKDLIRLMNSDWNDQIFHTHPINAYFWTASSHLNSAMAIVVMENLGIQLEKGLKESQSLNFEDWQALLESMSLYRNKVKLAFDKEIENRPYSPRGYLMEGRIFGDDNMYLEPQPWMLMRHDISVDRKRELYALVKSKLIDNEVLGARQLENPTIMETEKGKIVAGESENGAFWFSLNSPLILGVNTFDKEESLRLLEKMTFNNFAQNYPDYWVGQWSNADCVNSSKSDYPGLSRPDFWTKFPVYCSHPHAWPLYCYFMIQSK